MGHCSPPIIRNHRVNARIAALSGPQIAAAITRDVRNSASRSPGETYIIRPLKMTASGHERCSRLRRASVSLQFLTEGLGNLCTTVHSWQNDLVIRRGHHEPARLRIARLRCQEEADEARGFPGRDESGGAVVSARGGERAPLSQSWAEWRGGGPFPPRWRGSPPPRTPGSHIS